LSVAEVIGEILRRWLLLILSWCIVVSSVCEFLLGLKVVRIVFIGRTRDILLRLSVLLIVKVFVHVYRLSMICALIVFLLAFGQLLFKIRINPLTS